MKRISFVVVLMAIVSFSLGAQSFSSMLDKYTENQSKVKTMVNSGNIYISMYDSYGNPTNSFNSRILVYMKSPDLFKLVTVDPLESVIVQKGNLISKRVGNGAVVTEKGNINNDMFSKYFNVGLNITGSNIKTSGAKTVVEDSIQYTVFRIQSEEESNSGIAYRDMYFNKDGMICKTKIYDTQEKVRFIIEMNYTEKNNIYIAKELKITNISGQNRITSNIIYNSISVNTEVLDREFLLK